MNDILEYNEEVSPNGNPLKVKKKCEWTGKEFWVIWKNRKQRFIDKESMYEWRKHNSHESVKCKNCGKSFTRYKSYKHWRNGSQKEYCSKGCWVTSDELSKAKSKWTKKNQPMNNPKSRKKISETKKKRYGDPNYNNLEKNKKTCMKRYGVPFSTYLPQCQSAGKTISKFQRKTYDEIKKKHSDALLEHYLDDVQKSVDIYIPTEKLIIECFGDYWHCNPKKYDKTYYNKNVHKTAEEIWKIDRQRIESFSSNGYKTQIVWESH